VTGIIEIPWKEEEEEEGEEDRVMRWVVVAVMTGL
jgi:hypothetical protein